MKRNEKDLTNFFGAASFSLLVFNQAETQIDSSFPASPVPDTTQGG